MNWLLVALIAPIFWAITNHIDKYLISKYFKGDSIGALMIFSSLIGVFLLPIIYFFDPMVINIKTYFAFILILNGFLYVIAMLPYFYALAEDEASIVAPLFQLIPVFSYFLGLIFLGENLTSKQLLSSTLVILGALLLTSEFDGKKQKFKSKVFWLMVLSSFLTALNGLVFKYVAINENFLTTSFWEYIGFSIFAIFLIAFVKSYRKQFFYILKQNKVAVLSINGLNEVLNIIAKMAMNFATLLTPLAVAWVINGFQPFFIIIFGIMLTILFPKISNENLKKNHIIQKIVSVVVMFIGMYLLNS